MEAQGSEFLEESPWWGRREPGVFCAVSEWVGLLLMEKTIRAGGGLQVPFPGLLSGCLAIPEPSPCHPKPFIFIVLHTFIWNKRDPFPNQGLKICHLDISISNPLPRHHRVASLQGRGDHSHCTALCWGQFWCFEGSSIGWAGIHRPSFPHATPGSAPRIPLLPPPTMFPLLQVSPTVSPHIPHLLLGSRDHSSLHSIPVPPPHLSVPPHSCAE